MSSFTESFDPGSNIADELASWLPDLEAGYPNIAAALLGEAGWEKDRNKRPAYSLIITTRDGRLKFTLSNPERDRTYHCGISSAKSPLEAIEAALAANQGEWVKKRQNGTSNR